MQIEIIPIEQAKAEARASRLDSAETTQIAEMIQNLQKDEGVRIKLEEGKSLGSLKARIKKVAEAEGVQIEIKTGKNKGSVMVWRSDSGK